jgi:hypothetical protein
VIWVLGHLFVVGEEGMLQKCENASKVCSCAAAAAWEEKKVYEKVWR